jgi:hypothetical protein
MVSDEQKIQTQNIDSVFQKYMMSILAILIFSFIFGGWDLI